MSRAKPKISLLFVFLVLFGLCSGCVGSDERLLNIIANASGVENEMSINEESVDAEQDAEKDSEKDEEYESKDTDSTGTNETDPDIANETSVLNLMQDLESSSYETRMDAASELGEIGQPAADTLIEKLGAEGSETGNVNSYILLALLETGDERAADVLIRNLDKGEEPAGDNAAEEFEGREISEELLQAVEAKDETLREYIADSLDDEYGAEAGTLVQALNAEEQNADVYITIALSEYGDPGTEDETETETEKLIRALKSENGYTRTAAVMALGELEEKSAVDLLLQKLTQDYPLIRVGAALSLGMIGDERAAETLLKEMKSSGDEYIRSSAAIALGKIGTERATPFLAARLRDGKAGVRSSAALALGMIGDETAVEPLIEILESGKAADSKVKSTLNADPEVRKSAVLALGEIGGRDATKALIDVLLDAEESQEVRKAAAEALGTIGDPRTVDTLSGVLNDAEVHTSIKGGVISALGEMEDRKAAEALIEELEDKKLGSASRDALAGMGETAVEPLIECLSGGDEALKTEAALLLIEIGDKRAVEPLIQAFS